MPDGESSSQGSEAPRCGRSRRSGQRTGLPVIGCSELQTGPRRPPLAKPSGVPQGTCLNSGYVEGQNVFDRISLGRGDSTSALPALAASLVDRHVTVICATPPPAAVAAKAATSTIPVVFTTGLRCGCVSAWSRASTGPAAILPGSANSAACSALSAWNCSTGSCRTMHPSPCWSIRATAMPLPEITEIQEAARALGQQLVRGKCQHRKSRWIRPSRP